MCPDFTSLVLVFCVDTGYVARDTDYTGTAAELNLVRWFPKSRCAGEGARAEGGVAAESGPGRDQIAPL